jgi:hypothetical protein
VLENDTINVKMNNSIGPYFPSHKGVRQGDPLSPLLFNITVDVLTRLVYLAQQNNLVTGLIANLTSRGIAILQYAYDTILCLDNDEEKVRNVKLLLFMFGQMNGLKLILRRVKSCW